MVTYSIPLRGTIALPTQGREDGMLKAHEAEAAYQIPVRRPLLEAQQIAMAAFSEGSSGVMLKRRQWQHAKKAAIASCLEGCKGNQLRRQQLQHAAEAFVQRLHEIP